MKNYLLHLKLLFRRLALIMLLFTITRILFYLFNQSSFGQIDIGKIVLLHIQGLRFDLATLAILNLPFIFFSIIPVSGIMNRKSYQTTLMVLFLSVNLVAIGINFVDVKFFEFEQKRLTSDIFTKEWLGSDFITLLPAFVSDYWYLFLSFFAFAGLLIWVYPKLKSNEILADVQNLKTYVKKTILFLVLCAVTVYAGRGGIQLKPIDIITAAQYTSPSYMPIVLNSPFTIIKTMGSEQLTEQPYFSESELDSIFNPVQQFDTTSQFTPYNVVIIILESFGREYSGYLTNTKGYTPNFDSIMQQGTTFKNGFANGKRSIEALPSIISGIPALMNNPIITSRYAGNSFESLGQILKEKGYHTSFYHGGKNGTMGFDNYSKLAGIEHYFGIDEYPDKADYDGNWGIFDEPYLQYYAKQLSATKAPFFSVVFTLSSHHPYKIPEQHAGKFPKGTLVNHESIGYADYALGEFFKTAAKEPWFNQTLFVLTADHTAQTEGKYFNSNAGKYAVPVVFYHPTHDLKVTNPNIIVQQTDILPSVLDYLNYNKPFVAFGSSIFDTIRPRFSVSYIGNLYQIITNSGVMTFNGEKIVTAYKPDGVTKTKTQLANPDVIRDEDLLKAIIQQYNQRMLNNTLTTEKHY